MSQELREKQQLLLTLAVEMKDAIARAEERGEPIPVEVEEKIQEIEEQIVELGGTIGRASKGH